jgi:two-component system, chemotaxis family, chemotaxis protein CheY
MRVLVADDQKSVGTSLAELVGQCQHDVVQVVGSGLEAIQAYARYQPDVVVMDYRMPKLNGATACRYILANDPHARIVLISGWASEHLHDSGALTVLPKPVTLDQLRDALDSASNRPGTIGRSSEDASSVHASPEILDSLHEGNP